LPCNRLPPSDRTPIFACAQPELPFRAGLAS